MVFIFERFLSMARFQGEDPDCFMFHSYNKIVNVFFNIQYGWTIAFAEH